MKRNAIALFLALVVLASGCTANRGPLSPKPIVYGTDLMANVKPQQTAAGQTKADSTAFAIELLKKTYNGKNTVVSPVSAYLALSMVANGAKGETLKEFEKVLGAPLGDLDGTCKALMDALNKSTDGLTLKTVNGIWYNTKFNFVPNPAFLQTNADYFGAAAIASDFSNPATVNAINRFVSDNTNKLIPTVLDKLDADNDVMVLLNTLYFKGEWKEKFNPALTRDGSFVLSDGTKTSTKFMSQTYSKAKYIDCDSAKGMVLPYVNERFAFVAILPNEQIGKYLSSLTPDDFKNLLSSAEEKFADLLIPKFEVTVGYNLNSELNNMGITSAFDPGKADFSLMGDARSHLYLGLVRQNTVFKLGEKGTEAAAATVAMMTLGIPRNLIRLDHPFLYALMDMQTGTPLFLGVMDNPTMTQ